MPLQLLDIRMVVFYVETLGIHLAASANQPKVFPSRKYLLEASLVTAFAFASLLQLNTIFTALHLIIQDVFLYFKAIVVSDLEGFLKR